MIYFIVGYIILGLVFTCFILYITHDEENY